MEILNLAHVSPSFSSMVVPTTTETTCTSLKLYTQVFWVLNGAACVMQYNWTLTLAPYQTQQSLEQCLSVL